MILHNCNTLLCMGCNDFFNLFLFILGLDGVGSHVTALEQYYVLMMMESSVSGFLEHPEDGKLTQQRWNGLRSSRLEIGFAFVQLLPLQSTV